MVQLLTECAGLTGVVLTIYIYDLYIAAPSFEMLTYINWIMDKPEPDL